MVRIADCVIRRVVPQPTEWQDIGNEIDAAVIFAWADVVSVHSGLLERFVNRQHLRF